MYKENQNTVNIKESYDKWTIKFENFKKLKIVCNIALLDSM